MEYSVPRTLISLALAGHLRVLGQRERRGPRARGYVIALFRRSATVPNISNRTLSGILRCSPKRSVLMLKERFERVERETHLPDRKAAGYAVALRKLHSAILGVKALIEAFPYSVPHWCPDLITDVLARHTYDPIPISTTVRNCASSFKKTHQDTWHEDALHFNEEQLQALSTLLSGTSYCTSFLEFSSSISPFSRRVEHRDHSRI